MTSSAFTGNRTKGKITFPISTLDLLVNQLIMGMSIRVSGVLKKWRSQYKGYQTHEKKQGGDKVYGWGGQKRGNGQKDTPDRSDDTKKSGRDPKIYTGELFLETSQKMKGAFKIYFDAGYRKLYFTEMTIDTDKAVD